MPFLIFINGLNCNLNKILYSLLELLICYHMFYSTLSMGVDLSSLNRIDPHPKH